MQIDFRKIKITLTFEKKFTVGIPFSYIFRSVIGKQLHYLSCVLKQQTCNNCPLRFKCAYSVLFENPINKDNMVIAGRDKAPSPYIVQADYYKNREIDKVDITVIFVGSGIDYISYFLLATKLAGENGMFKERIKYEVSYILCINNQYSMDYDFSKLPLETYIFNDSLDKIYKEIKIKFITPFRYKKNGKYTSDIDINDILLSSKRRLDMLSCFYGNGMILPKIDFIDKNVCEKQLFWSDSERYSRRQDNNMKIGGILGEMIVKANWTYQHLSLLDASVLFNIGKNVSFGLGYILYEEI